MINTKEFLTKKIIKVDYSKVRPFLNNKSVKEHINFLQKNYNLFDNVTLSLNDVKTIFLNLCDKFKTKFKKDYIDDKYNQAGMNRVYKKLKQLFNKIWGRALSIVCSISANVVVYVLGYLNFQSLMATLVFGCMYTFITFSIKYFSSRSNNTDMLYEPSNIKLPKLDSVVEFIKFISKFIKDTVNEVFNWFFYEIDEEDNKKATKRYRRWFLLSIIIILVFVLIMI